MLHTNFIVEKEKLNEECQKYMHAYSPPLVVQHDPTMMSVNTISTCCYCLISFSIVLLYWES